MFDDDGNRILGFVMRGVCHKPGVVAVFPGQVFVFFYAFGSFFEADAAYLRGSGFAADFYAVEVDFGACCGSADAVDNFKHAFFTSSMSAGLRFSDCGAGAFSVLTNVGVTA